MSHVAQPETVLAAIAIVYTASKMLPDSPYLKAY